MLRTPPTSKAAALQREHVAQAKKKHEKEMATFTDGLKEETARDLYDMPLTEKQMRGMPVTVIMPALAFVPPRKLWTSDCCSAGAYEYRSIHIHGQVERFYRCEQCGSDCKAAERR